MTEKVVYSKKILAILIVFNLFLMIHSFGAIGPPGSSQTIYGYVTYSDGSPIPNGITVYATNHRINVSNKEVTFDNIYGTSGAFLFGDIASYLPGTIDGDTIEVNVSYGGCQGNNTVLLDYSLPTQRVDIIIHGNLPADVPEKASTSSGNTGFKLNDMSISFQTTTTDHNNDDISYGWDFNGDEQVDEWSDYLLNATTCTTSYSYTVVGVYPVKVKTKDEQGAERGHNASADEWSPPLNITIISEPPRVNFTYTPLSPTTKDTIQFTDNSTDPDDFIINWSWDFGDDNTYTGRNSSHRYADDGTYTVTLNVTDNSSVSNETTRHITVANTPPTADFTYTPTSPTTDDTIQFTDNSSDSDGSITEWHWEFGDNTNATTQHPNHTYNSSGSYQVNLTVTDNDGSVNTTTTTIMVTPSFSPGGPSPRQPTADFTYHPSRPIVNTSTQFTDMSTDPDGEIVDWYWEFGDGAVNDFEEKPTYMYTKTGSYTVALTVTDNDGNTAKTEKTVVVTRPYNISKDNMRIITLKTEKDMGHATGRNYIVWKGQPITASNLSISAGLTQQDTISKFNVTMGTWTAYTGEDSTNEDDFVISPWDIINIRCMTRKNIYVDVSKQQDTPQQFNFIRTHNPRTGKTNNGYNYFTWPKPTPISAGELAEKIGLTPREPLYKYYPQKEKWVSYAAALPSVFSTDFTVSTDDILCVKVITDKKLVFGSQQGGEE